MLYVMQVFVLSKARTCFRPDTEAEKNLKEEIERLKMELEKVSPSNANKEPPQVSGEDQTSLHDIILHKERELEQLTRELDDKLRFSQKAMERPSSGAGRLASFPERSPFPSGSFEESRNVEYMERPRSRGTADAWARHGDDRRGFQGGRERGFLGNRDLDRYASPCSVLLFFVAAVLRQSGLESMLFPTNVAIGLPLRV